jgi:hypothetical protein
MRQDKMAHEFAIERQTKDRIEVRHVREGHVYSFPIVEGRHLTRKLAQGPVNESQNAKRESTFYAIQARLFAEREGRKAGRID